MLSSTWLKDTVGQVEVCTESLVKLLEWGIVENEKEWRSEMGTWRTLLKLKIK